MRQVTDLDVAAHIGNECLEIAEGLPGLRGDYVVAKGQDDVGGLADGSDHDLGVLPVARSAGQHDLRDFGPTLRGLPMRAPASTRR